jgi:hypothetical protein
MPNSQFTAVDPTWIVAGTTKSNIFTAQQVFKAPTTVDAGAVFQATGTISTIPTMDANAIAMFQGTEGTTSHVFFASAGSNAHFVFQRRQGTYASPTAVQSGNILGAVQWQGYGASTFGATASAEIRGVARQAFTESARGSAIEFYVTTNSTTTLSQLFVIEPTLVYSTTAIQAFNSSRVSGNAGNARDFRLTTSTVDRWRLIANATAESGSNAGSNFDIRRYSDAGADLGSALFIERATGVTTHNASRMNLSTAITGITSSGVAIGNTGDWAWDDTYFYVKMSTGWRRIALGASF